MNKPFFSRWSWLALAGILSVSAATAWVSLHHIFNEDLALTRKSAEQQLQLIASIISSEMGSGRYQDIGKLFNKWAQADDSILELRLDAANGFNLASYKHPSGNNHILELKFPISYSYHGEAKLSAGINLEEVYQRSSRLVAQVAVMFVVFAMMLAFLLYMAIRLQNEARRTRHLSNLYKALSEINQSIVRMQQQAEIFPLVCRCAVDFGGMSMAWVGLLDEASGMIVPVASYGSGQDYLDGIVISPLADVAEGRGPIGIAYRENRAVIVNNYYTDPITAPWKERAADNNWRSAASFPIPKGGRPFAVLSVYHMQTDAFDKEAIALLDEMSRDITFALENFEREKQRIEADKSLQLAASVYAASSEGIMITDADNRIISVNPAFTNITGYNPEEVIEKDPRILRSGRHDEAFYHAMWQSIETTGKWSGEIWDRRKNGDIYPKWLFIDTVFNADRSVLRRVAMFTDISKIKEAEEMIWHQANFDSLTELPNRQMLHDRLDQDIKKAHRGGRKLALMYLDLDQFKEINDTLGHNIGDTLIKEVAHRLSECVRETDTVARLGGDEFIIILNELDNVDSVDIVAQSILHKLAEPYQLEANIVFITASIGITLYPDDGTEIETLLKNADQAMYAAKDKGRNSYSYFTPSMQLAAQARMQLSNDLRGALVDHQFWIAYQPIVELATGSIHKAEALIRWQHPTKGLISPIAFIPVAEDTGLINDIGDWIFHEAAQQAKLWCTLLHPAFQISVNKSPVQFHNKSLDHLAWPDYLRQSGLSGQSVVVEITEGLLLDSNPLVAELLIKFREAGIQVSIDDFGTGFSALSYLKKFDVDYLKIDQSFIRNLAQGSDDMALCEAIIVMAHKLAIKVIAEGVETMNQCNLLKQIGCDYGQGFLWTKPLPAAELEVYCLNR